MGLYDRDYAQAGGGGMYGGRGGGPQMRLAAPALTPGVKWLLIVNVAVFVLGMLPFRLRGIPLGSWIDWLFAVDTRTVGRMAQIWRLVTYQFLHGGLGHIFFNMLMLYMMGVILERHWGTQRFLGFYLGCGVCGALVYCLLTLFHWLDPGVMVGASGSILGVLAACAILFPQITLYVWGIFPLPIRVLALILMGIAVLTLLQGEEGVNAGGEAAHLGGMVAGALYVWLLRNSSPAVTRLRQQRDARRWATRRQLQGDVDAILDKVHREGIHSLSARERRILQQATDIEQRQRGGG